jgi:hypothetical protein
MAAVRAGATLDDAAEANGIDRATLARARAVAKQSENATVAKPTEIATPQETPVLAVPAGSGTETVAEGSAQLCAAADSLDIPSFLRRTA